MKEESQTKRKKNYFVKCMRLLIDTLRKWHYSNKEQEEERKEKLTNELVRVLFSNHMQIFNPQ